MCRIHKAINKVYKNRSTVMMPRLGLVTAALALLAAITSGSPAGKVLHAKPQEGQQGYEEKHSSGRSVSKRSVDLTDAKFHVTDSRLPRDVIPIRYQLELQPYPDEGHFKGRVKINITCEEPTDVITLHAHENLHIAHSEVTVKQLEGKPTSTQQKDPIVKTDYPFNHKGYESMAMTPMRILRISSTKKEPSKQWYVITLAEKLRKGIAYQLDLSFTGPLSTESTQGFFRVHNQVHRTKEERWLAATKMSPSNARRVFPCFDEPDIKTPFKISVAHSNHMLALSNMPLETAEEMKNETGWTLDHFKETPPMSTFSVAVAVLDLECISNPENEDGMNVFVFARPSFLSQIQDVVNKTMVMLDFLQNYLGVPFSLPKLDLVALPHYADPEPADHWGLIILKESDFTNDDALTWRLADELAQQWFGHLATPVWWGDARINKAIANYLAALSANQDKCNRNLIISYSLYYEYSKLHPYANLGSQEEYIKIKK
ncbi:hypothetical protein L9F63_016712, partial [Diploptera punctata]